MTHTRWVTDISHRASLGYILHNLNKLKLVYWA